MANTPSKLTAAELDLMTPDERASAFEDRIVTDAESLPVDFRDRIFEKARRLADRRAEKA